MKLIVERKWRKEDYTIGILYVNGVRLCNTLEDAVRPEKIYGKTAIPAGTYRVLMNTVSPKFEGRAWSKPYGGIVPRLRNVPNFQGVLIHCLTPETEILTENGWQNLENFKANPATSCFSYNTDTHKIELSKINFMVEEDYEGKLYYNEGKRFNYAVTDKHRMFCNVKKRDGSREWQWRTADDIPYGAQFLTSGVKSDGWNLTKEQKILYRLVMATQADGYILNWSNTASQVRFHFKKERKIERLKFLLDELGEQYRMYVDREGKTHIILSPRLSEYLTEVLNPCRLINCDKTLPKELLLLKSEDIKDLLLEYLFWDGRYENYLKNNLNMTISTTLKTTADILQSMASLCGVRSYAKLLTTQGEKRSDVWEVVLYDGQDVCVSATENYGTRDYNGKVWCLNNDNHSILIRCNGRTMIVGNCGNSAADTDGCILVGDNTEKGKLTNSTNRYFELMGKLLSAALAGESIDITILEP